MSPECILCVRYCVKCFIFIVSFNPYKALMKKLMLLYPLFKCRNEESWSKLPKFIQLVSAKAGIQIQVDSSRA